MRRSLVGLGLFVVAACGQVTSNDPPSAEQVGTTKQDLVAYNDEVNPKYLGDDLGDHELSLTFDDGPGPMEVSGAVAQWLHDHKDPKTNAAAPIQATFFVLGSCIGKTPLSNSAKNQGCDDPTPNADAVLAKEISLGHYVGNHTVTHRVLTTVSAADLPNELSETDGLISKYLVWNRMFFRAPTGAWNATVFNGLKNTAMNKYFGPVYWNVGGGAGDPPVTADLAADWACWEGPNGDGTGKKYSTRQCGDRYIKEIRAVGNKGIVLMHDAKGDTNNHDLDVVPGNTFDMLKYVIGELEKDATPWKYKRLDEVPSLAAILPKCDASCVQCSGPADTQCTECTADKHVEGGKCVAGAPPSDAGADEGGASSSSSSTSSSSSSTSGNASSGGSSSSSSGDAPAAAADDGKGCNATGGPDASGVGLFAAAGLALAAISRRSKRRRT